jgi:phosphoglycolate phosphatase
MKNIVFDCDGTLISSHEALLLTLQKLVTLERKSPTPVAMHEIRAGYDADMLRCARNFNLDISEPSRLLKLWGELSGQHARAAAYEGMATLLQNLEQAGHRLVVWTGRDRASTLELLRAAGILRYFEELCCADDTTPKPHPAGLAVLLDGHDKNECLHIGDSYTDIQGARDYGISSVGALWGEHATRESFGSYHPDHWCSHPLEILKLPFFT